jgi:hypothetical protein
MTFVNNPGWCVLSLAICLAATTGCTSWNLSKSMPWPIGEEKPGTPDRIVAVWTDTILYTPGRTPERGFGGRIMFYQAKKDQPIKVEGSIVVYTFDETNRAPNNSKPDRKYVFTPDQLPAHYSKSKIGHSYSVWLPWDEVGGSQKEVSVVVRFEPKAGAVVMGELSRQLLPGKPVAVAQDPAKAAPNGAPAQISPAQVPQVQPENQPVQQTAYVAALPQPGPPVNPAAVPPRRMTTTTIAIPSEMASNPLSAGGAVAAPGLNAQSPEILNAASQRSAMPGCDPSMTPLSQAVSTVASAPPTSGFRPRSRFSPPGSRPLAGSSAPPARDRAPWPQRPEESPSGPGVPPGSVSGPGSPTFSPAAGSATY